MKNLLHITLILIFLWFLGLGAFIYSASTFPSDRHANADAVIVLTGGNGRIEAGLRILAKHRAVRMFISGVDGTAKLNEVLALHQRYSRYASFVEIGQSSYNTISNAQEVKAWIIKNNIRSIILVTADYHMERSLYEFRRILPDITIYAHPVMRTKNWWLTRHMAFVLLKEYNKYAVWRILNIL